MRTALSTLILVGFLCSFSVPAGAQTDPALKTAVLELVESFLKKGPKKEELSNGSAIASWAILKGVALPAFTEHESLRQGTWDVHWRPIEETLTARGFGKLRPLQALTLYEETKGAPPRFVRLLGRRGLIDPKKPAERKRAKELRVALGKACEEVKGVRSSARYEGAGWKFTGTAFLDPGKRIVRLAIRGSQPCKITGSARVLNLNLKGRLFEDRESTAGIKIQILDKKFTSHGCELNLKHRINSVLRLSGGGEAKTAGNLNLLVRDDTVTGRFQIDLVSKQVGVALLTGRAVYTLKGKVSPSGELDVQLLPVSSSGSRVLRQQLETEGTLTGIVKDSRGSGVLNLSVLKEPIKWSDNRKKSNKKKR